MQIAHPFFFAARFSLALSQAAAAAEVRVLTAGAMKETILALAPDFERTTGHKVMLDSDTAGELSRRIEGGEVALEHQDLAALGAEASRLVHARFSWDKVFTRQWALYTRARLHGAEALRSIDPHPFSPEGVRG